MSSKDKRPKRTKLMKREFLRGFDFKQLPVERRQRVQEATDRIRQIQARMATHVVELGKELIAVHAELGAKMFPIWAAAEFHYSVSTCGRFMRAAQRFGDLPCLEKFQSTALIELAASRVDDEVIEEAVERAQHGEEITRLRALEMVERHEAAQDRDFSPRPRRDEVYRLRSALRMAISRWPQNDREKLAGQLLAVVRDLLAEFGLTVQPLERAAPPAKRGKPVRFTIDADNAPTPAGVAV